MKGSMSMAAGNGSSNLEIAQSNQDLIMTKNRKKKRVWIISGIVLLVVLALVITAIVLLTSSNSSSDSPKADALALEDLLQGRMSPKSFNASWISDTELLYRDASGNIVLRDLSKNVTTTILPISESIVESAYTYDLSPDHSYLLISHNYQKLYRYSYTAQFTIVNLENADTHTLRVDESELGRVMQYASWGPLNNSIIFVHRNNIYYKESVDSNEIVQVTNDGVFGTIYNGVPDWVYEEEVFNSNVALWVSPDGKKVAYAKFDDTNVTVMTIPYYGEPGSLSSQYTLLAQIRYPKPGTTNPSVGLHVVDLGNTSVTKQLLPSNDLISSDPILTAVSWATDTVVSAIWTNRLQNQAAVVSYNTETDVVRVVTELQEPNGWLELFTPPKFSKDGSRFLLIVPQDQGNSAGAYRHLTLFQRLSGTSRALTAGRFIVLEIVAWNEDTNLVYYLANTESNPGVLHLYSVSTNLGSNITCLTCQITSSNTNTECSYNSALFSTEFSYYVLNCNGPGVPESALFTIDSNRIEVWEANEDLHELIKDKQIPTVDTLSLPIANGFTARITLKLPPNLDTTGNTKYPMLVNVYGGPDSNQITEQFGLDWGSYLAANKSIIYASIDGRGSGLRGNDLLFTVYRNLGTVEIVDQINVTRQLQESLPYIDSRRTAIWGWSYGGYATGMALATDSDNVFRCGMSVAPVTDWTLYDSIYTERFMGLPNTNDNYEGYSGAQLINKFEGLRNKEFFLIHGTLDDNVHYQQSMLLSKILEQKDILFRQQSYPDESHGLASVRPHLYHSLETFLDECFA